MERELELLMAPTKKFMMWLVSLRHTRRVIIKWNAMKPSCVVISRGLATFKRQHFHQEQLILKEYPWLDLTVRVVALVVVHIRQVGHITLSHRQLLNLALLLALSSGKRSLPTQQAGKRMILLLVWELLLLRTKCGALFQKYTAMQWFWASR